MILFEQHRKMFKTMEILLSPADRPSWKTVLKNLIYFLIGSLYCEMAIAYIYKHGDSLGNSTAAMASLFASTCITAQFIFLKFNERNVGSLIDDFQKMIENGMVFFCILIFGSINL